MGHGHDHSAGDAAIPRRARWILTAIAGVLAIVTAIGVGILWPRHDVRTDISKLGFISQLYDATVLDATHGLCTGSSGPGSVKVYCQRVKFRLEQGPDRGFTRKIELADSGGIPILHAGDDVVLSHIAHAQPGFDYNFSDYQRRPVLLWLAVLFAVVVIVLGRFRGLAALVGLGASIVVILRFMLPSMLDGNSPALVAIFGASAVAFLALYLANGLRPMTTVALLGTLSALALTVVLASVFTSLAHFTGATSEDALLVKLGSSNIDLKGLVLAGMVLGALGALNDITVTQASAVGELRTTNPDMPRGELYRSGLRIGRDHISSTVNTLALAYAGASLPLLILFSLSRQSLGTVANGETVAIEIVSTLVGSVGLVAAVPISTWFATLVATEHSHSVGHRTVDVVAVESDALLTRRERRTRAARRKPRETPVVPDLLAPRDGNDFWE